MRHIFLHQKIFSTFFKSLEHFNFENKIEKYIGSDFTHLSPTINNDRINNEYICLTAGKEVKCS